MPPLPRISVPALARLAEELRFAPRDAILRDLDRIEALGPEIEPEGSYPEDWIVFRATGFRADADGADPAPGEALLRDLSALAERLSVAARLSRADLAGRSLTLAELAERWRVSPKTIERLRRRGLIARRVVDEGGKWRLAFMTPVVDAFAARNVGVIGRAAGYSRMDEPTRRRVIRCAMLYRRAGLTLNQAAWRISRRYGRSHEAIRQQLIRYDQRRAAAGSQIFGWRGPTRRAEGAEALERAAEGLEPRRAAAALKRSAASVRRGINLARTDRLRGLELRGLGLRGSGTGGGAGKVERRALALDGSALETVHASTDLGAPGVEDLLGFIAGARRREVPLGVVERARAAAYRELVGRAGAWIAGLDAAFPSAEALDVIETALRWAARVKVELVRAHLALVVQTIEERAGLRLEDQRAARALELVELGLHAAARAVDGFEPSRGGRLAAPITMLVTREVSRWMKDAPEGEGDLPGRAQGRLARGTPFPDWTREVSVWQEWLEPRAEVRGRGDAVSDEARHVMGMRMGWPEWVGAAGADEGGVLRVRPRTCAEIASMTGLSATAVARLERRAIREALGANEGERRGSKGHGSLPRGGEPRGGEPRGGGQ
jgi:RNA polymerase primary sigma factor